MKRIVRSTLVALAALAAAPALADNPVGLAQEDWWNKEGFGFVQGYYTQLGDLQGGGFAAGGEYVNEDVHFGIGASFSMDLLYHDYKIGDKIFDYSSNAHDCDAEDFAMGMDLHIPVRIGNSITIYAGAGLHMHVLSLDFRDSRPGGDLVDSKAVDSFQTTDSVFFGLRWRLLDHAYVFGEYRREFGNIEVGSYYTYGSSSRTSRKVFTEKFELDVSDDRFVVGLGVLF